MAGGSREPPDVEVRTAPLSEMCNFHNKPAVRSAACSPQLLLPPLLLHRVLLCKSPDMRRTYSFFPCLWPLSLRVCPLPRFAATRRIYACDFELISPSCVIGCCCPSCPGCSCKMGFNLSLSWFSNGSVNK